MYILKIRHRFARFIDINMIDLIATNVNVFDVGWMSVEDLIDHSKYDFLVRVVQARTYDLKVFASLAQIGELLELEHKLEMSVGLHQWYHRHFVLFEQVEELFQLVRRVVVLVRNRF